MRPKLEVTPVSSRAIVVDLSIPSGLRLIWRRVCCSSPSETQSGSEKRSDILCVIHRNVPRSHMSATRYGFSRSTPMSSSDELGDCRMRESSLGTCLSASHQPIRQEVKYLSVLFETST